jgi:hypothetical protein
LIHHIEAWMRRLASATTYTAAMVRNSLRGGSCGAQQPPRRRWRRATACTAAVAMCNCLHGAARSVYETWATFSLQFFFWKKHRNTFRLYLTNFVKL